MLITPTITQANGIISVQLAASFVGDANDATDKANVLAFGDPQVNLTGGMFVDNTAVPAVAAAVQRQDVTYTCSTTGNAGNAVTILFVANGTVDATAISTSGDAVTVDILPISGPARTTAQIAALFASFGSSRANTSSGGVITASGGSSATAIAGGSFNFSGGTPAFTQAFNFQFPASDLYVGVTTQLQGFTARFMTQLPPPLLGIPASTAGPLDCVTSDPQHAAKYWITVLEGRISSLMTALRQRTTLSPQSPVHV
jgi:hypothetical protein